jgi:hypothetical protein
MRDIIRRHLTSSSLDELIHYVANRVVALRSQFEGKKMLIIDRRLLSKCSQLATAELLKVSRFLQDIAIDTLHVSLRDSSEDERTILRRLCGVLKKISSIIDTHVYANDTETLRIVTRFFSCVSVVRLGEFSNQSQDERLGLLDALKRCGLQAFSFNLTTTDDNDLLSFLVPHLPSFAMQAKGCNLCVYV